ncbi:glutathione transferase [Aureococcus anophagefferens]|nr:glutathione transferase [Aureococcus anophagefferens]
MASAADVARARLDRASTLAAEGVAPYAAVAAALRGGERDASFVAGLLRGRKQLLDLYDRVDALPAARRVVKTWGEPGAYRTHF